MSYKCLECGHIFEDGEHAEWEETHGLDCPPYEKWSGCPLCKGGYEETTQCKICGSEHLDEELECGVCEECYAGLKLKYKYDYAGCFKIAEKNKNYDTIGLNGFLIAMFSQSEIEKILMRELATASTIKPVDCSHYIEEDKGWFIENAIKEEVTK